MKLLSQLAFLALAPVLAFAQAEPAAKKAPLSSADKALVKSAGEAQLGVMHLSEFIRGDAAPGSAALQAVAKKANADVQKSWGELATAIQGKGAEVPKTDLTPAEKKDIAEVRKLKDEKFDKAYLKSFTKESKKAAAVYANGAKAAQDADLKAYFAKWEPAFTAINEQGEAAEKEAGKKK